MHAPFRPPSSWKESKKGVEVTWNSFFAKQPPEKARRLIETFANVDACLTGQAREIRFFSGGQLVGRASPDTGIVVADYLREWAPRTAPSKGPMVTVRGKRFTLVMARSTMDGPYLVRSIVSKSR